MPTHANKLNTTTSFRSLTDTTQTVVHGSPVRLYSLQCSLFLRGQLQLSISLASTELKCGTERHKVRCHRSDTTPPPLPKVAVILKTDSTLRRARCVGVARLMKSLFGRQTTHLHQNQRDNGVKGGCETQRLGAKGRDWLKGRTRRRIAWVKKRKLSSVGWVRGLTHVPFHDHAHDHNHGASAEEIQKIIQGKRCARRQHASAHWISIGSGRSSSIPRNSEHYWWSGRRRCSSAGRPPAGPRTTVA